MFTYAGKLAVLTRSGWIAGGVLQEQGPVGWQMWQGGTRAVRNVRHAGTRALGIGSESWQGWPSFNGRDIGSSLG